jgi:hypothetical protein
MIALMERVSTGQGKLLHTPGPGYLLRPSRPFHSYSFSQISMIVAATCLGFDPSVSIAYCAELR